MMEITKVCFFVLILIKFDRDKNFIYFFSDLAALKTITRYDNPNACAIPRASFCRVVRDILEKIGEQRNSSYRIQSHALAALQVSKYFHVYHDLLGYEIVFIHHFSTINLYIFFVLVFI